MVQLIKGLFFDACTILLTIGLYIGIANGLTVFFSERVIWYDLVNGLNDTQMIFCIYSAWCVTFGPLAKAMKKVAKFLPQRQSTLDEDDYE